MGLMVVGKVELLGRMGYGILVSGEGKRGGVREWGALGRRVFWGAG